MSPEMIIIMGVVSFAMLFAVCMVLTISAYKKFKKAGTGDMDSKMRQEILGMSSTLTIRDENTIVAEVCKDFSELDISEIKKSVAELMLDYLNSTSRGDTALQHQNVSERLTNNLAIAVENKLFFGITDIAVGSVRLSEYTRQDSFARLLFRTDVEYAVEAAGAKRRSSFDVLVVYTSAEEKLLMYGDISVS